MSNTIYKKLIFFSYFNLLFFSLNSKSLFFLWICFELNMLMFLPLTNKLNNLMINNMMKYFIIQSISSSIFLYSIISKEFFLNDNMLNYTILLSMWVKLGFFPFNSWYFQITENMTWNMYFLINTFQKLIPLWILSNLIMSYKYMLTMMYMNSIYSFMEIWNQTSYRWLLNSSSLNHFSWMILSFNSMIKSWQMYIIMYTIMFYNIIKELKMKNMNSTLNMFNNNMNNNITFFFIMLNFMGMPPMMGFFPKMFIMLNNYSMMNCLFLFMINLMILVLYFYMIMNNLNMNLFNKTQYYDIKNIFNLMFMNILNMLILTWMMPQ